MYIIRNLYDHVYCKQLSLNSLFDVATAYPGTSPSGGCFLQHIYQTPQIINIKNMNAKQASVATNVASTMMYHYSNT